MSGPVLVTGCSSGIGRATALRLQRRGLTVYASARRPAAIADLERHGCHVLALDVADETSRVAAVEAITEAHGVVWGLVNNAGYGQYGAIEEVDLDDVRRQFETNVFGLARLCQLVLPGMRRAGTGRIVNVSSMGGRLTFPGGGYYHASKHAVEAISDALRFEVAGFGIQVVVVEPGLIRTAFADTAVATATTHDTGPYAGFAEASREVTAGIYDTPLAAGPEAVAAAIDHALTAARPRTRYRVTVGAKAAIAARRLLPDRLWDAAMRASFPRPGVDG